MNIFFVTISCSMLAGAGISACEHETHDDCEERRNLPTVEQYIPIESGMLGKDSEMLSRTFVRTPDVAEPYYEGSVKTITEIDSNGEFVRLGDGSCWSVWFYFGRKEVRDAWQSSDEVVITFNPLSFIGTPIVLHNITKGFSVYALRLYSPKPCAPEAVTITSIDPDTCSFQTSAGTIISAGVSTLWVEYCVGDLLHLMLPTSGISDGSRIYVWNVRLGSLNYEPWLQCPIQ